MKTTWHKFAALIASGTILGIGIVSVMVVAGHAPTSRLQNPAETALASSKSTPSTSALIKPPSPAASKTCKAAAIDVTLEESKNRPGFATLVFTNISRATCTITGAPEVTMLSDKNKVLATSGLDPLATEVTTVALSGEGAAYVQLSIPSPTDVPKPICLGLSRQISILLPDDSLPLLLPFTRTACEGLITSVATAQPSTQ